MDATIELILIAFVISIGVLVAFFSWYSWSLASSDNKKS